jgi:hypothetical protein
VAELAVTFLLYLARDVDRYRGLLRRPSNAIYEHMHSAAAAQAVRVFWPPQKPDENPAPTPLQTKVV